MPLTRLLSLKLGALVFLFILMLQGYNRSSAMFFSIYILGFSAAIDALTAYKLQRFYFTKLQIRILIGSGLFSLTAAVTTVYYWVLQSH